MPNYWCYTCNGSGRLAEQAFELCQGCFGKGVDNFSNLYTDRCRTCNGYGKTGFWKRDKIKCHVCKGQGFIKY